MKAKLFLVLIILIGLFSCQKDEASVSFETVGFKNLRSDSYGLLTLVDSPRQILKYDDLGGALDTIGETKLFYRGDLISHRNWETTYMSSIHHKTDVLYSFNDDVMIVLIRPDYLFSDRLLILNYDFKKEFNVVIGEIKLAEIDLARRVLRITHNNSWARTGEIPDETSEFEY
jgi:hypothetical protein